MTEEYARIARSVLAQRAVHKVITMLGDGDRVLAHCFAGKDRTGFTSRWCSRRAGVDRDAIMADYLASNAAVPELRAHIVETIRNRMSETPEVAEVAEARLTDAVLGVQEAYLDAARGATHRGLRLDGRLPRRRGCVGRGRREAARGPARLDAPSRETAPRITPSTGFGPRGVGEVHRPSKRPARMGCPPIPRTVC